MKWGGSGGGGGRGGKAISTAGKALKTSWIEIFIEN